MSLSFNIFAIAYIRKPELFLGCLPLIPPLKLFNCLSVYHAGKPAIAGDWIEKLPAPFAPWHEAQSWYCFLPQSEATVLKSKNKTLTTLEETRSEHNDLDFDPKQIDIGNVNKYISTEGKCSIEQGADTTQVTGGN